MNVINRAKNMIISPKTEWDVAAAENTPPAQVITGYVLPLAGAAALALFIGMALIGAMFFGAAGIGASLVAAIWQVVMAVVGVFVLAFIIDNLAPTFAGTKGFAQAVKVSAYSYTPVWVFGLLMIIPPLGGLAVFIGMLYGLYLLYLGLPRLMRAPQEKAVPYTVVVIVCAIVLGVILMFLGTMVGVGGGMGMMGRHVVSGAGSQFATSSGNARLDELARKMEAAGKNMEAAQKSGDSQAQAEAAMAALGTAFSGGKGVDPVQADQLKPFVPERIAGLPRTDLRTDRSGVKGLMATKAEASYAEGEKNVTLEIVDTGGAAGLMGMATWMGVQGEREDSQRREVTRKEGTRLVHEEQDKQGGSSKYLVVLNDRFVVSAEGNGVDVGTLKSAVHGVNLAGIESLK